MRRLLFPLLLLAPILCLADDPQASAGHRNVVLFVVDDQGFQAGCYGNGVIKTPNIDRLAKSGTRFTRAHCTTASCSASRSVLMTGLQNHATGHFGHAHSYNHFSTYASVKSLPVMLKEAGYRTCSIGKYHLAPEYIYKFDEYRNKGVQGNRNAVQMAKNAKEWISEEDDKPFFLYFCTSDPHRGSGPDRFSNYNDDPDYYPGVKKITYKPEEVIVPPWLPDNDECRRELAEYYQAISRLDQGLGTLLDALEETGHRDDTLILFLSDNGPPFPGAKTNLYQPGMNLPLIVSSPDQKTRGKTTDAVVTWADITPSILDFCGVKPLGGAVRPVENRGTPVSVGPQKPLKFHGESFLSTLDQEHPKGFDSDFASHTFHEITMYYPMRVAIAGDYKYIYNIAHQLPYPYASDLYRSPTWQGVVSRGEEYFGNRRIRDYTFRAKHELYNLKDDPHELHNLADDPDHKETLLRLQTKLKAWQKATRDPWISKWEYE